MAGFLPVEYSFDALEVRQDREITELEASNAAELVKLTKKKTIKALEAFQQQQLGDLKALHRDQYDELEDWLDSGGVPSAGEGGNTTGTAEGEGVCDGVVNDAVKQLTQQEDVRTKAEAGERAAAVVAQARAAEEAKVLKARQKRLQKAAKKLAEAEATRRAIEEDAGPNMRELELESIQRELKKVNETYQISEIQSDGNCLYRALAHQRHQTAIATGGRHTAAITNGSSGSSSSSGSSKLSQHTDQNYIGLRLLAAQHMRANPDDFMAFLGEADLGSGFEEYCRKVESSGPGTAAGAAGEGKANAGSSGSGRGTGTGYKSDDGPVWGGQLEIQALSLALHRSIEVYSADAPVLVMNAEASSTEGDDSDSDDDSGSATSPPLRVTYHRHYFALGAHYNSVVKAKSEAQSV